MGVFVILGIGFLAAGVFGVRVRDRPIAGWTTILCAAVPAVLYLCFGSDPDRYPTDWLIVLPSIALGLVGLVTSALSLWPPIKREQWAPDAKPGWYSDPKGTTKHQAYWDGAVWTGETRHRQDKAVPRGAAVGLIVGGSPGLLGLTVAILQQSGGYVLLFSFLAFVGAGIGLGLGSVVGLIGRIINGAREYDYRQAHYPRLDPSKVSRALEAKAMAEGLAPEAIREQLVSEFSVFRNVIDDWLIGDRGVPDARLGQLARALDTRVDELLAPPVENAMS